MEMLIPPPTRLVAQGVHTKAGAEQKQSLSQSPSPSSRPSKGISTAKMVSSHRKLFISILGIISSCTEIFWVTVTYPERQRLLGTEGLRCCPSQHGTAHLSVMGTVHLSQPAGTQMHHFCPLGSLLPLGYSRLRPSYGLLPGIFPKPSSS